MSLFGRLYAAGYDWVMGGADRHGADEHRRRLVEEASGEVLEVGAGTGLNFRHYRAATSVVAVEPDLGMRARAQRRAQRASVAVEVVGGDAMALPFADGSFDTVVFSLVLCTIPDPARAIGEAHRVLRPGGALRFYEHVRSTDARLARRQDRLERPWRLVGRGCRPNRDSAATIERAGFAVSVLDRFEMDGVPRIVAPHVLGVAHRA
jgi:ubiquinone/menaquinone biosynthesis C-methylase UbiE